MIRFSLLCAADHQFEGWFRSNDGFEAQAAHHEITCPVCGDASVRKAIMAPAIARATMVPPAPSLPTPAAPPAPSGIDERSARMTQFAMMLRAMRAHVESNFDHVGERFPEEARKMHYGEVDHRDIYGEATPDEVSELLDEGIQIRPLPPLSKLDG